MGDNVVLRFQYLGRDIDCLLNDLDKCNFIDLIIDYWENAKRDKTPVPKYPHFRYFHKSQAIELATDEDLMKMFQNLHGRDLIYIWVVDGSEYTNVVKAALSLREKRKIIVYDTPQTPPRHIKENQVHISQLTQTQAIDIDPNISISPGTINDMIMDNFEYLKNKSTPKKGKVKLRIKGGKGNGGNIPEVLPEPEHVIPEPVKASFIKRRLPKTTTLRKGLWRSSVGGEGNRNNEFTTTFVDTQNNSNDVGLYLSQDDEDTLSLYDEDEVEGNVVQNEVTGDEIQAAIYDDFDPYEGPVWEDDCDDLDNYIQRIYNNGEFYTHQEFGKIVLKPWLFFTDKQVLKDVVRDYCIQCGFSVITDTSSNKKYTVICSDETCQWRLHASKLVDGVTWAIKSIQSPEHTCFGLETKNKMVSAKWASRALIEDIRANNDISGKALNELLWNRYGVEMSKSTLYRMKAEALLQIHGAHDISYSYLPTYCQMVKSTNPNSVAEVQWYPENHPERPLTFSCLFISFKACVDGLFEGCRGVIGVDGTFLKGHFGGVLLSAVALDGNNEMFPIAWGIGSGEDETTWKFFIHHLKALLYPRRGHQWCIISDRHKAIEKACNDLWPEVGRRYCMKHLSVN